MTRAGLNNQATPGAGAERSLEILRVVRIAGVPFAAPTQAHRDHDRLWHPVT